VIGDGVTIEAGARVGPRAVIGAGSRNRARATLEATLVWEDAAIGAGATLRECVVGPGVRIGAEARLGPGAVVEPWAEVPAGTHLPA
jgi:mannose-1-phosphate guanylyltransferase